MAVKIPLTELGVKEVFTSLARRAPHGFPLQQLPSRWAYTKITRPPVVFVADGEARLVVRRETFDDLLATDLG